MEIELGKGIVAVIDDEDWELVKGFDWRPFPSKSGGHYAVARVFLHKLVMGADGRQMVDHRDGDKLNCRKQNLRSATHKQNAWNVGPLNRPGRSHPYKGVTLDRKHGRFKAQIMNDGKRISLGYHETAEDAARAYDRACLQLRGEWARLNFPNDEPLNHSATVVTMRPDGARYGARIARESAR